MTSLEGLAVRMQTRTLYRPELAAGSGGDDHLVGTSGDDELSGLGGNDTLDGLDGNDILDGGTGDDGMTGGAGDDTYYIDSAADRAVEVSYEGFDILYTTVSFAADYYGEIEVFAALDPTGAGALDISANFHDNVIRGNEGANVLSAGSGDDKLYGFGGNDTLLGGEGVDYLYGGPGHDRLTAGNGYDELYGGAGNDVFDAVSTRFYGDSNRMYGDTGNDTYYVDRSGDLIFENPGQGFEIVYASGSYRLMAGMEVEVVRGIGAGVLELVGNELPNQLYGPDSAAVLRGLEGDDLLAGGAGDDSIDGGLGSDTASYASAAAAVAVRLAVTSAQDTKGAGSDTLNSIENLVGSAFADTLSGDPSANRLDGRAGADVMKGGKGDDLYVVDNQGDKANEASDGGTDLVSSSVSYSLGAYVENLTLTGAAAIGGTGNSLANLLTGNSAANRLSGGGGSDSLSGGAGNDRLYGGAGNDSLVGGTGQDGFYFDTTPNASTNVDKILGFSHPDDTIFLDRDIFTGLAAGGALAPSAFRAGTAALDADDRILYDAATGRIFYDRDGSGAAAATLFAEVAANSTVTSTDFVGYI